MKKYLLTLALLAASMNAIAQAKDRSVNDNVFDQESIDSGGQNEIATKDQPFTIVEQMPSFPGGDEKMMDFILTKLTYPISAQEAHLQGQVMVRFIVEVDGSLSNLEVIHGFNEACEKEVIRIIELMPQWNPGKQDGKEVRVYYTVPVTFRMQE